MAAPKSNPASEQGNPPKHTPGPWHIKDVCGDRVDVGYNAEPTSTDFVASCGYQDGKKDGECTANARLIAAAPDMLEALEAMVNPGHPGPPNLEQVVAARAAIAKARGQSDA